MRSGHFKCGYRLIFAIGIAGITASAAFAQQTTPPAAPPLGKAAEAPYLAQNTVAMNIMMANMAAKPTGNVDDDFVAMMTPHHQGAIDMAQAELQYGHNPLLARVAQGIIVEQLQEIAAMRLAIGEPATPTWQVEPPPAAPLAASAVVSGPSVKSEKPYLAQNDAAMSKMMAAMAVTPTGDVDHDFVAMMVPHHQGGIDMARAELGYGHNPQLMRVAQEIVVSQIQEISMMRLALGEPLPPSVSSPTQPPVVPDTFFAPSAQTSMQMSPHPMSSMSMDVMNSSSTMSNSSNVK